MARTHVQQSQISGSLSFDDSLAAGSALASQGTLVGDLDALRSQINKIVGKTNWYEALDGSQDLADIYTAVHMDGTKASFQGAMDVSGVADFQAAVYAASDLNVSGAFTLAGAADLNGSLNVQEVADFQAAVYMGSDLGVSGTLTVAQAATLSNGLTVDTAVADFNAGITANEIKIDSDVTGRLYLVGAAGELEDSDKLFFDGTTFQVTGSVEVSNGLTVAAGGLTVAGDSMEITGSFGVFGATSLDGTLGVSQLATFSNGIVVDAAAADFNADVTANKISIDGDTANRLYIVDADGSIKDEEKLTFDGSELWVDGTLEVTGGDITMSNSVSLASSAADTLVITAATLVQMSGDLEVQGGMITLTNGATIDSETAGELKLDEDLVYVTGDLKVGGNDIKASDDSIAISLTGADVSVKGDLTVEGNEIKSTTGTVLELSGLDAIFKANVQVDGDLRVKGATTYIDTQNMRVEDAFIYLATGSVGTTDSGIVLHGGAGAGMDLVIGQDGGAGEVIFGKGNRAPDGDGAMDGIDLVAAWMSEVKFGVNEGALSGSVGVDGSALKVSAEGDLKLAANGETAISFIGSGEFATFDSNFTATTVVGALNELYAAGAGGAKKGNLSVSDVTAGVLDFSAVGTLNAASQQFVDVYLNGVLLAYGSDVSNVTTTSVDLEAGIASSLIGDDVLTVVLRGAA